MSNWATVATTPATRSMFSLRVAADCLSSLIADIVVDHDIMIKNTKADSAGQPSGGIMRLGGSLILAFAAMMPPLMMAQVDKPEDRRALEAMSAEHIETAYGLTALGSGSLADLIRAEE